MNDIFNTITTTEWLVLAASLGLGFIFGSVLAGSGARKKYSEQEKLLEERLEEVQQEKVRVEALQGSANAQLEQTRQSLDATNRNLMIAQQKIATLEANNRNAQEQLAERAENFKRMSEQFENLAHKIFDDKSQRFKTESSESLKAMLNPLQAELGQFRQKVEESFGTQGREQATLKGEIRQIVATHEKLVVQTDTLARALRGNSKVQGDWGEMVLARILQDAGLREGEDFILQAEDMGLKNEEGRSVRPDVIVNLPDGKQVVIDAKVSLTHFERACAEPDEQQHLRQFIQSVRSHISSLGKKQYHMNENIAAPDFTLMFVPIEPAFMAALQYDKELLRFAWEQKVALVCPTTLYSALRTIASLWSIEMRNRNADEIARMGGGLYDKVVGFVEDMQKLGISLDNSRNVYENAMNKLRTGRGNILSRVEALRDMGVTPKKTLDPRMLESSMAALELLQDEDVVDITEQVRTGTDEQA